MEDDRFRTRGNRDAVSDETGKHMKKEEIISALASGASVLTAGDKAEEGKQYDVIFLPPGTLELAGKGNADNACYIEYIRSLLPRLKADGRVLLVAENRYGIRNWCGKRETYTDIPFEGIAGYQKETNGRSFDRRQLTDILEAAGLSACHFYYPMPDYENAVRVYTDTMLPTESEAELLGGRYHKKTWASLLFRDTDALKDIIRNQCFPFFANEFLVEAGRRREHLVQCPEEAAGAFHAVKETGLPGKEGKEQEAEACETGLRMEQNRHALAVKGYTEVNARDFDQDLIHQVVKIQLDLLKELKRICDEYGLRMYAIYGTLLGAVRHGGVIPGDDDIDVALPREDYEKLLSLGEAFQEPYFLQTPWNDDCFFGGFLKLRNRNTTSIHPQNRWVECCEGIGIDIFPLDAGYRNQIREKWKEKRICFYQRLLFAKAYGYAARFMDMPLLIWKGYKYLGKPFTRQKLADRLNYLMSLGDDGEKAPLGIFAHYTKGRGCMKLPSNAFRETVSLEYEDIRLDAPAEYDKILEKRYGKEYMRSPHEQKGKHRHGFYVPDVPYPNYKKRFSGLFRPGPEGKEIVLFADDTVIRMYFEQYGKEYPPAHIVALEEGCLPDRVCDIPVTSFDSFISQNQDQSNVYPVICSIWIRDREKMLRSAGYREYYFFVGDREWMLLADPSCALEEVE